jgi:hypothetical protein
VVKSATQSGNTSETQVTSELSAGKLSSQDHHHHPHRGGGGFDKALKEASKEPNLDKRLADLKQSYESNKYDELFAKLKDAESKNEYLTSLITQLQSKRSANSGYRLGLFIIYLTLFYLILF